MSQDPSYVHLLRSDIDSGDIDLSELAIAEHHAPHFESYPSLQLSPLDTRRGSHPEASDVCLECQNQKVPDVPKAQGKDPIRRILEPESDSGIESISPPQVRVDWNYPIRKDPTPAPSRLLIRPKQLESPIPAFPARDSDLMGAQMATLYFMSLIRDIPWTQWPSSQLVRTGCQALNQLKARPLIKDQVTPLNLFRCSKRMTGPYVSQFLYRSGRDLDQPHILTGRDLAGATHIDNLLDFFWNLLIFFSDLKIPLRPNFETDSRLLEIQLILGAVTQKALQRAESIQSAQSTPRPQDYAQEIDRTLLRGGSIRVSDDLLQNRLMPLLKSRHGNYLLSQIYPELISSFPSVTATVTGACVTVLKFFYQTSTPLPTYEPSDDGSRLKQSTVGQELDQLSFNMGLGQCWAGLNYPIDIIEGLKIGQQIALQYLESKIGYKGPVSVPLYNGTNLTIGGPN